MHLISKSYFQNLSGFYVFSKNNNVFKKFTALNISSIRIYEYFLLRSHFHDLELRVVAI